MEGPCGHGMVEISALCQPLLLCACPRRGTNCGWGISHGTVSRLSSRQGGMFRTFGQSFFFFSSRFARCSSWARRALMIACANGPPARYMRTINYQARRTARRKPTREKASSRNWRSPREKHFASFISHGPVSWITPPVRGLTLPLIGSVPRLFRNTHRRLFGSSQASLLLQEHARGLL